MTHSQIRIRKCQNAWKHIPYLVLKVAEYVAKKHEKSNSIKLKDLISDSIIRIPIYPPKNGLNATGTKMFKMQLV